MKINSRQLRKLILQEAEPIIRRRAAAGPVATELVPTESEVEDLSPEARKAYDASEDGAIFMIGYNEGADDASIDKPHKYGDVVPNTPATAMDDFTLGYSYGYDSFTMVGVDTYPRGSASNMQTGDYEIHDVSEGRKVTRKQLRKMILLEMERARDRLLKEIT